MNAVMWFILGALCGGAVWFFCRPIEKHGTTTGKDKTTTKESPKAWVQTRNFLYYDGTEMPVVKEDLNE